MDKIWSRETEASQRSYTFIMRHYLDGEDQQYIPTAITHLKQLVKIILAASFVINLNFKLWCWFQTNNLDLLQFGQLQQTKKKKSLAVVYSV